jgi:hypothetical protein
MRMTASRFGSLDLPDNKVVARLIKWQPRLRLAARAVSTRQPSSFRCALIADQIRCGAAGMPR